MDTKFICEIGSNHNQNLNRVAKLIRAAKEIGCWAVKFQFFEADKLYSHEFKDKIEQMKNWELPDHFIPVIRNYCNHYDIKFGCSVFNANDVNIIKNHVDFLKIGSYELLNTKLIKTVSQAKKPWMISMGLCPSPVYIQDLLSIFSTQPTVFFHCNSNYPAEVQNCELNKIKIMKKLHMFNNDSIFYSSIGWSDHTVQPGIIYQSIAQGAEYIEFHMDLEDKKGFEYSAGHCWLPEKIQEVITNVQVGEKACNPSNNKKNNDEIKKWRMDPEDGMRPLKKHRKELLNELGK